MRVVVTDDLAFGLVIQNDARQPLAVAHRDLAFAHADDIARLHAHPDLCHGAIDLDLSGSPPEK